MYSSCGNAIKQQQQTTFYLSPCLEKKLVGALLRKVVFGSRYGRKINKKMMTLHQRRQ